LAVNAASGASSGYVSNWPCPFTEGAAILFDARVSLSLASSGPKAEFGLAVGVGASTPSSEAIGFSFTATSARSGVIVLRSSSSGTSTTTQASWTVDTLGAGALNPSGVTADWTKIHGFRIEYFPTEGLAAFYVSGPAGLVLVHVMQALSANPLLAEV